MKLSDAAHSAARLSVASSKSRIDLEQLLQKWFEKHFVKGAKLPLLRDIYNAGAYDQFAMWLDGISDPQRLVFIKKLEPHRPELLNSSRAQLMDHVRALASGQAQPTPKPKKPRAEPRSSSTSSGPKRAQARKPSPVRILAGSKY